jgi:hypothetical protein
MRAVQKGDVATLKRISNPRLRSDDAISQKISSIGKRKWSRIRVTWPTVIAASTPVADVTAVDPAGAKIYDRVILDINATGSWVICLGDEPEPGTGSVDPLVPGTVLVPRN